MRKYNRDLVRISDCPHALDVAGRVRPQTFWLPISIQNALLKDNSPRKRLVENCKTRDILVITHYGSPSLITSLEICVSDLGNSLNI